jgi:hypothetical protein
MNAEDLKKLGALTLTSQRLPTRKGDLVEFIMRYLEGNGLQTVWRGLDELQRAAVAEVVHSEEDYFQPNLFHAKYGRHPVWESGGENRYHRTPSPLRFFFYKGVMPQDLKERLKAFVAPPAQAKIASSDSLPAVHYIPYEQWNSAKSAYEKKTEASSSPMTVHERERAAQRELISVLRLIDAGKIAVSDKTRRPSSSAMDAVAAVLEGGDYYPHVPFKNKWDDENAGPIRAFAWPLLVQAGGVAQLSGTRLQLTKAGRNALSASPSETIRALWTKWQSTTIIDEFSRIECVKGQSGKGHGLTAVTLRRNAIADILADCPAGVWISTDELFRFMMASGGDYRVSRSPWKLYVCELQYGSLGSCGSMLEERYLFGFLLEYAATLGLLDVALIPPAGARRDYGMLWGTDDLPFFSRYDGLPYFRINPLGAYCLELAPAYQSAPLEVKPVLRVLPNLEIAATGSELELSDRLALDAYAMRTADYVWRLDAGKLLSAIEEGRPVAEIREFLAARSGADIPDTVARFLDDVAERTVKLRDCGLARLIECDDSALAALLANDSRTRKYCMRAGERHLAVPASSERAFNRAVKEAGYLIHTGERVSRKNSPHRKRAENPPRQERGEAGAVSIDVTMSPASDIPAGMEATTGD